MSNHKKWWQFLSTHERAEFRGTENLRLYGLILSVITTIFITVLFIRIIIRLKNEQGAFGASARRHFYTLFIGSYIYSLSLLSIRGSMFLTDGEWGLFGAEKGIIFVIGFFIFIVGIVGVSQSIIDFESTQKLLFRFGFYSYVLLGITVFLLQILNIIGINPFEEETLLLQTYAAILAISLIVFFIYALFRETQAHPSKIEQLRLNLLSVALITPLIEVLVIGYSISLKNSVAASYPFVFYIVVPLTYLIFHPIKYILLTWSLFTPNWLLIKANIIQPSFSEFLEKQGSD